MIKEQINEIFGYVYPLIISELILFCVFGVLLYVAILFDLSVGIRRAKAMKEKIYSGGFRKTFVKFSDYTKIYYFGFVLDCIIIVLFGRIVPVGVCVTALAACSIELKSIHENMKITKIQASNIINVASDIIKCTSKQEALKIIDNITNIK